MRPYHLVFSPTVDHDDGYMGACSGECSVPSCLMKDRSGLGVWLRGSSCAVRPLSAYGCHERFRSVSSCRRSWLGWKLIIAYFFSSVT